MAWTNQRILLRVSVGSANPKVFLRSFGAIEEALQQKFPQYQQRCAFLSRRIMDQLEQNHGVKVDSLTDALTEISGEDPAEVLIQPLLLTCGSEYREMLRIVRDFSSLPIKVAKPLLSDADDLKQLASFLAEEADRYRKYDTTVIFVGHGGKEDDNIYTKLQQTLDANSEWNLLIGTLKGKPSFYEVLRRAKASFADKVVLLPLLLSAGSHAEKEIAGDGDSWKNAFQIAGFSVECVMKGLGEYKEIREMFLSHTEKEIK